MRLFRFTTVWVGLAVSLSCHATSPTPRNALLALEKQEGTLAIIDPLSNSIVARVPAGQDPHEIVVSADGKRAYISNYGGPGSALHTISVIDLVAQTPLPPIDLGALHSPHGLAYAAGKLYFTAETSKVIGRVDPATGKVDWVLGTGQNRTHMILVSEPSERIFTSNISSGTICIIERNLEESIVPPPGPALTLLGPPPASDRPENPSKSWNVTVVPTGRGSEGFDLSPDGKELWVENALDDTVSIIDVVSKSVKKTLSFPGVFANRLKFTPDGKLVLMSHLASGDLLMVDPTTRTPLASFKLGKGTAGIQISPDGTTAYVAVGGFGEGNKLVVLDLASRTIKSEIALGKGVDGLAWAVRN